MQLKFPSWHQIETFFLSLPIVAATILWSKTHSFPGFFKVSIYDVVAFIWYEIGRITLFSRANAMAFSFFLSLFPAIIFLFTVATHIPIYDTFKGEINGYIDHIMPTNAGTEVKSAIERLVKPNTSVLSLGFILTIYFSSNGMLAMMEGFEKLHLPTFKRRPAIRKRLIGIALTMLLGMLLVGSVVLIILGNWLIGLATELLNLSAFGGALIDLFRWMTIILLFYFGIAIIYRYGAAMHQRFRWLTPGATLATIFSLISSLAFSFYVEYFDTYNKVYGSIGTIMVLMLWIQINCLILLIGFELNASIAVNRQRKKEVMETK